MFCSLPCTFIAFLNGFWVGPAIGLVVLIYAWHDKINTDVWCITLLRVVDCKFFEKLTDVCLFYGLIAPCFAYFYCFNVLNESDDCNKGFKCGMLLYDTKLDKKYKYWALIILLSAKVLTLSLFGIEEFY